MMYDNSFGKYLCNLRKINGITQRDLANALSVSDKAISKWEVGYSYPDVEMLLQISKYFNIPIKKLIDIRVSNHYNEKDLKYRLKKNKLKKIDVIKIIGIVIGFFKLIISIIELFFLKVTE